MAVDEYFQVDAQALGSLEAFHFILDCLSAADYVQESVARVVVPQNDGYIVRSDILSQRLLDCPPVKKVVNFAKPLQSFSGKPVYIDSMQMLPSALVASAGAMLLTPIDSIRFPTVESLLTCLDLELNNRLAFTWLSIEKPKRQTLAIVDGGLRSPDDGGTGESIYTAAEALGIDMVVLDYPEHWLNESRYRHWYKSFIPFDTPLHPDAGYASRIVDAVRSFPGHIDGLVTLRDQYKIAVAEAALQLGLFTDPPSAFEITSNKFKTSVSVGHNAFQASSIEQAIKIVHDHHLDFPLIIKPCNGFLSEGVFRAESLSQLETGIHSINTDRHGVQFVLERYCDGPEVDANLVLCDGELLFFEASDDFPKSADSNGKGSVKTFIELANVLPSRLPQSELTTLRNSLHQSLIRMGFQNGFFHLEARMENSSMEYGTHNNILDLTERSTPAKVVPSAWLIEVNPRPPGIQESEAVRHTYGVDYFGLALLFGLNDRHRIKQLSDPFVQGPQYWCEMVFIPVDRGGVFTSGDVCAELFSRRPDLVDFVSKCFCFLHLGDKVPDPGTGVNAWVAYFNVFSRESRAHLLEIAECVRKEVKFCIL
ncbi:hypothetical protein N7509_013133 [Penicillium cosmopolitanum]|uniref:ATP-grasp domain-containing protein n=1 Tax=Penicillium cosmopolitanum TaxID=1131564 RepID=A0A9W9SDP4_9EURO|nr:uncharacterized protein N7509_013133 [Penicillium cosmopolitanum]KAJ5376247.1 hypothetical protein N7509_013133 [Penicillium cosmopolitanum]